MITFTINEVTRQLTSLESYLIGGILLYISYRILRYALKDKKKDVISEEKE